MLPAIAAGVFAVWKWRHALSRRRQLLDALTWRGDETVLDVGCGSGLMLNGAAKRLTSGKAIGIDLWTPHSGGGNLALLRRNAKAEGVADQIEFKEADARQMPFEDKTFDVVLCSGALHHIVHGRAEFDQVMRELRRVLKPGGQIVLWDITHMIEASAARMRQAGVQCDIKKVGRFLGFEMCILFGHKAE
jgi:ubiquinone/menaquinone biosynthesis C-methylase UbiE